MGGGDRGGAYHGLGGGWEEAETRDWGTVATIYSFVLPDSLFSFVALLCRLCTYGLESPEQQNAFGLCSMPYVARNSCASAYVECIKSAMQDNFNKNGNRCKRTYPSATRAPNALAITFIPIQLTIFQGKQTSAVIPQSLSPSACPSRPTSARPDPGSGSWHPRRPRTRR